MKYMSRASIFEQPDPSDDNQSEPTRAVSTWSKSLDRASAVAAKIDTGTASINQHLDLHPDVPLRGAKRSGIGTELGQEGLEESEHNG
jgi:acyl-CoA reductase-like NAD-dependent aldehyde dehydrogenase